MSHTRPLRTLLALPFLLTLISAPLQARTQTLPSLPDLQSADSLGADLFLQSGSTGMVLVVVRDNQVFFRGYGETAPDNHQLPTQDSFLRLCSLTKIFTTDVLTKLIADKTVSLDDPLQSYAPRRAIVPKRVQPITLEDLATHTSGLPRELGTAPRDTPHFTYPDYRTRWRWLPNQRLHSTPGTAALYSNIAFDLLSDALQSAAHQQYAALLAQRTLNPLHMYNTTFFPTAAQCSRLLIGDKYEGLCTSTEQTAGSSGLYSTAADMPSGSSTSCEQASPHKTPPRRQSISFPLSSSVKKDWTTPALQPASVSAGSTSCPPKTHPTSSRRPVAALASPLTSPSTTLATPPSSSPQPTAPSRRTPPLSLMILLQRVAHSRPT